MAEVEFHLHNEVGIKFPPLQPAYTDGDLFFGRFRGLVARSTGTSVIGEGGTGRIHLVRDELMEREVALKIPLESILRDPAAREDVIQETRQAMDLTHPNIVRIHDFHEGGGLWGISMQFVRGRNLDEWRYEGSGTGFRRAIRPYPVEEIRDWIAQLCDALAYAHEDARMVHRDIKPKNLMLEKRDAAGKIFITDFGISQRLRLHTMMLSRDQSRAGESRANMGTLPYMPWEQIVGAPASPLDDVYAVGATIYELVTGRPPFYDGGFEQIKVQIREVPPPSMEQRMLELGLHMPPPPQEWEEVVAACLAKRPEDRPQSMRALAEALGFASGHTTELEARLARQAERIQELEIQIGAVSHSTTAAADPAVVEELAAARRELEALTATEAAARRDLEAGAVREAAARDELASLTAREAAVRQELAALTARLEQVTANEHALAERLAATERERDSALEGGDVALQQFQEESARRIAKAEETAARLQAEVATARAAGEAAGAEALEQARRKVGELEAAAKTAAQAADRALQQTRQEAAAAAQAAADKHRRELEAAAERTRKAEEQAAKALAQARAEDEQRLQQQAGELEKTRQSVAKLAARKEELERGLAVERERQGASLKPLLVSLLVAMGLGLGGGYAWTLVRSSKQFDPVAEIAAHQGKAIPSAPGVAKIPVASALFRIFLEDAKIAAPGGLDLGGESVRGVNGQLAIGFCNWLTTRLRKDGDAPKIYFTLPTPGDLKDQVQPGTLEWTRTWAKDREGLELTMINEKGDGIPVHTAHSAGNFTFRVALEKVPAPPGE